MTIKQLHKDFDEVYYITVTCYDWIPLINITNLYDFIYRWFARLDKQGIKLLGYVIMPNHFHILVYYPQLDVSINTIISEGKRFMAYEIIKRLKGSGENAVLLKLRQSVSGKRKTAGQNHRVFSDSFDCILCRDLRMANQKLDYIHKNPVSGTFQLADSFIDYQYSSASFYELGTEAKVKLDRLEEYF